MADLVVVGAGPAGIGAAAEATRAGLGVTLVDAWSAPGGQIHARPAGASFDALPAEVVEGLDVRRLDLRLGQEVWGAFGDGRILGLRDGDRAYEEPATRLVIATGGAERICPFPGWDEPTVISAGGAQRMLKTAGATPAGRVLIAGSGPFLRTVCADLLDAGVNVVGLVESRTRLDLATLATTFARQPRRAREAAGYLRRTRSVPTHHGAHVVRYADGVAHLSDGSVIACDSLLIGAGFRPRSELARLAGCSATASGTIVDEFQRTTRTGIWAAGEVTGIGGALLAASEGRLAGAAAAIEAGATVGSSRIDELRVERAAHRSFAAALWRAWPAMPVLAHADESTTICRCEGVTLGEIRRIASDSSAASGRGAKALLRCGMGPCQGATCGEAVRAATGRGEDLDERWEPRVRPPIAPVTIGALAEMEVSGR